MVDVSRRTVVAGSAALAALSLTPMGSRGAAAQSSDYPADYSKIVEASKAEGSLLIYSNIGEVNWRPMLSAFNEKYPWIKVQTLDLGGTEVFERYYAEQAAGSNNVDLVVSFCAAVWTDFSERGNVYEYASPEKSHLPDWSMPLPNVYSISVDPYIIVYNKALLSEAEWPKSMEDIAHLVKSKPDEYNKKLATIQPWSSSSNESQLTHYIRHVGEEVALSRMAVYGPASDFYRSGGPIFEKVTAGEYAIGYQISAVQLIPLLADPARAAILGWSFPADGTVLSTRLFSIAKTVKNPNAAKLFVDFMLSKQGQESVSNGGLMPYRSDIQLPDEPNRMSYDGVVKQIGQENVIQLTLNPDLMKAPEDLIKKVRQAFKFQD